MLLMTTLWGDKGTYHIFSSSFGDDIIGKEYLHILHVCLMVLGFDKSTDWGFRVSLK